MHYLIIFVFVSSLKIIVGANEQQSSQIDTTPPTPCAKDQPLCPGGKCIPQLWKCDGEVDCSDGSDEKDCDQTVCTESQMRCDHGQCIPQHWECDGSRDCYDGSDEKNCPAKQETCAFAEFRCDDGACIDKELLCNQRRDCSDGSDEQNCTPQTAKDCTDIEYFCLNNSKCISDNLLCDGNNDCGDGADEVPLFCFFFPQNKATLPPKDTCSPGFKLMDDLVTCEDIDECTILGDCSQICNNTEGSFKCICKKCKSDSGPATLVYILSDAIWSLEMNSKHENNRRILYNDSNADIWSLDYDAEESKFFWTDWKQGTVNSYASKTNEKMTLFTDPTRPSLLKWDWLTRKLIYTNDDGSIIACDETGKYCATIVNTMAISISSFDIAPIKGVMFWSICNIMRFSRKGIIERADMDGSNRVAIVEDNLYWPSSIAVDNEIGRIYWVEAKSDIVEFADFEGRQRKVLLQGESYNPISVAIFEDHLFWADYNDKIYRCNKFSGEDCSTVLSSNVKAEAMLIIHKDKQPKGENRCLENNCPYLCLPNRSGSTCMCADGYEIYNGTCVLSPESEAISTESTKTSTTESTMTSTTENRKNTQRCHVFGGKLFCFER